MNHLINRLRKIEASAGSDPIFLEDDLLARCGTSREQAIAEHGSVHSAFKAILDELDRQLQITKEMS